MADVSLQALRRGDLAGATRLSLSRSPNSDPSGGLTELPQEVLGLADSLEVLDLSGHALTTLPDDFGRLRRLKVLFCSGNRFQRLPPVLGDCPALSQVGFRACGLTEVPVEALPPALRWLTLTDNAISRLPEALGQRPHLEKLMLAGNRLSALPDSLAGSPRLALIRLAANHLQQLPGWLTELPELAWLAWAGNPVEPAAPQALLTPAGAVPATALAPSGSQAIAASELLLGARLGEGASGVIHEAVWQPADGSAPRQVAVKQFKGAMTSDGLPAHELAASLAAGEHPNLPGALGWVNALPLPAPGSDAPAPSLLMPRLPVDWRVLADPPSPDSCSRDVYPAGWQLPLPAALALARSVAAAASHLHACGLLHGDLYAHNTLWDGRQGRAVLSDLGAASFLPTNDAVQSRALQRLELRAWGLLLGELLDHVVPSSAESATVAQLRRLQADCVQAPSSARPLMRDALQALDDLVG